MALTGLNSQFSFSIVIPSSEYLYKDMSLTLRKIGNYASFFPGKIQNGETNAIYHISGNLLTRFSLTKENQFKILFNSLLHNGMNVTEKFKIVRTKPIDNPEILIEKCFKKWIPTLYLASVGVSINRSLNHQGNLVDTPVLFEVSEKKYEAWAAGYGEWIHIRKAASKVTYLSLQFHGGGEYPQLVVPFKGDQKMALSAIFEDDHHLLLSSLYDQLTFSYPNNTACRLSSSFPIELYLQKRQFPHFFKYKNTRYIAWLNQDFCPGLKGISDYTSLYIQEVAQFEKTDVNKFCLSLIPQLYSTFIGNGIPYPRMLNDPHLKGLFNQLFDALSIEFSFEQLPKKWVFGQD